MAQVEIYYNGINPFSNQATPYLELSTEPVRYGKLWTTKETIKLSGTLVAESCNNSFSELLSMMEALKTVFGDDFKTLQVLEGGSEVFARNMVRVSSINFTNDITVKVKGFEITLEYYNVENFSTSVFGVIDPSFSFEFSEEEDGNLSVNIASSAKGIKTSDNDPLTNAINYVTSNVSLSGISLPSSNITSFSIDKAVLVSENENINRFESSYSLSRKYQMSRTGSLPFLFKYSCDLSYNEERGVYTLDLNGEISGGINNTIDEVRAALANFNAFSAANGYLRSLTLSPSTPSGLNPNPLSFSVNENDSEKKISFNYSYDSDVGAADAYFEYDTNVQYSDADSNWSVSLNGTINGRKGQVANWTAVNDFYRSVNVKNICQAALAAEGFSGQLEDQPSTYSATFDERAAKIQIRADYKQKKVNVKLPVKNFNYTVKIERPISEKKIMQTLTSGLKAFDLNCLKRGLVTISGSAEDLNLCSDDTKGQIVSFLKSELQKYAKPDFFLESIQVTVSQGEGVNKYSFNASASFEETYKYTG